MSIHEDPPIENSDDDGGPPQEQDPLEDRMRAREDQGSGPGPVRIPHSKAMQLAGGNTYIRKTETDRKVVYAGHQARSFICGLLRDQRVHLAYMLAYLHNLHKMYNTHNCFRRRIE